VPDSCTLIGVVDSHGILEDGEVFLQIDQRPYTDDSKKGRIKKLLDQTDGKETVKIIDGDVLVMKNPCSHAGDIRKLKAVGESDPKHEKLKHLYNVIVFSSKGHRPEQNKISGGDLDGDVYMTIWDKEFVEPFSMSDPSENDPKGAENKSNKESYTQEQKKFKSPIDFLFYYLKNDNLGQLANIHLAFCDNIGIHGCKDDKAKKMSAYL
jgi:RNA-dependent RNA polymerase